MEEVYEAVLMLDELKKNGDTYITEDSFQVITRQGRHVTTACANIKLVYENTKNCCTDKGTLGACPYYDKPRLGHGFDISFHRCKRSTRPLKKLHPGFLVLRGILNNMKDFDYPEASIIKYCLENYNEAMNKIANKLIHRNVYVNSTEAKKNVKTLTLYLLMLGFDARYEQCRSPFYHYAITYWDNDRAYVIAVFNTDKLGNNDKAQLMVNGYTEVKFDWSVLNECS